MNIFTKIWAFAKSLFVPAVEVKTQQLPSDPALPNVNTTVITATGTPQEVMEEDTAKAVAIVTNVKNALASPIAILVTDLIPGTLDNTIREQLVDGLPGLIAGLTFAEGVLKTSDKSAQLNALLSNIKFSDKPSLDALWHTLAARVLMIVSGGSVSWSNAVIAVEYYFTHLLLAPAPKVELAGAAAEVVNIVAPAAEAIAKAVEGPQTENQLSTNP